MTSTIAFTTSTDGHRFVAAPFADIVTPESDREPYCFVCGRCTDHFAEHDSLVALGLAHYSIGHDGYATGDVLVTDFARSNEGDMLRTFYDGAITMASIQSRHGAVTLIKPEGYAITQAYLWGMNLSGK